MLTNPNMAQLMEPSAPRRDRLESIRDIVVSAVPTEKYVNCGDVTKIIEDTLKIRVDAEDVRRITFTDNRVKRMWTDGGWKISRTKTLSDYL